MVEPTKNYITLFGCWQHPMAAVVAPRAAAVTNCRANYVLSNHWHTMYYVRTMYFKSRACTTAVAAALRIVNQQQYAANF